MQHVAEQADYRFDYARVTPEVWNQASALNGPDLYSYEPEPTLLIPVFDAITTQPNERHRLRADGCQANP